MDMLHITIAVPASKVGALYAAAAALLGSGSSNATVAASGKSSTPDASAIIGGGTAVAPTPSPSAPTSETASTATAVAGDPNEVDAAGTPWSADKHASTKGKTKDGLWRMKVGVARPANEGLPAGSGAAPVSSGSETPAVTTAAPAAEEDDEFAAFHAAAAAQAPVARNWTDADLSKLCNQAAVAAGGPDKVKAIIAKYVPAGEVPHSRSIPADQRETFAVDVETSLGIKYEG